MAHINASRPSPTTDRGKAPEKQEEHIMKRTMTMIIALVLSLACVCAMADGYTIGIGQFAQHASLDNCYEGFLAGLAEAGIVEGENLKVDYQNAQADMGIAQQIAGQFAGKKVDLMVGIATPMAQACYNAAAGRIPTIFTAVTDPVAAGFATADGKATGDVTGTSDALPIEAQLKTIRAMLPDAKKIGILYTTSEVNSLSAIEIYKQLAPNYGFEIVESGISTVADLPLAIDALLPKVDCLTNLTDNTVVSALALVLDKANAAKKPVFGSEIEQVKLGCIAAEGLDYVALGKQTGLMAAKVLKGEAKAGEIAYEIITEPGLYVNSNVLKQFGVTLSDELAARANDVK
ncbi:MAG: ABC transporter substrate-binding protein [Clostridia bacterium]|nr:ABC transporter substrate-binding protein [Clostridia bacterium]